MIKFKIYVFYNLLLFVKEFRKIFTKKSIAIFGASGFIGRNLVYKLAKNGWKIKALMRAPQHANYLRPMGKVGQVTCLKCNILDANKIEDYLADVEVVINLVGILAEDNNQKFYQIHSLGPKNIAQACFNHKIKHFIHISALGIDTDSRSKYSQSKAEGEKLIRSILKESIILRPSVIFGNYDNFINKFKKMASIFPFMPLIGNGRTKFQPLYVEDLISVIEILSKNKKFLGKTIELGGPEILSLKNIFDLIIEREGIKRKYIPIPFFWAKILAIMSYFLPNTPITLDQIKLLEQDNITHDFNSGFQEFNLIPYSLKSYLYR